ncbi:6-phosphogluconolactonase [Mucilaginibacter sp. PAMB04274]|uniref:6-phosphogluconolactonase n=1 Tax=Mucilaginibacter sp. PAMB04274 TaxID=3138568 RepID=UPI0031F6C945
MIRIFKNTQELSDAAAQLFVQSAQEAIAEKGSFTVALTGGSSPVALHKLLAASPYAEQVEWQHVFIFWGDERWVPMEDERSNAKMAFDTLLNHVPIPTKQIKPMYDAADSPEAFAAEYEQWIREQVGEEGAFDLIFLGMGDDGHTASLFPGTDVLHEQDKWVAAYYLQPQDMYRITLTAPLINRAKRIAVLTFGEKKTHALHEVIEGERNPEKYPSQLLNPTHGELIFMVDEIAASQLSKPAI